MVTVSLVAPRTSLDPETDGASPPLTRLEERPPPGLSQLVEPDREGRATITVAPAGHWVMTVKSEQHSARGEVEVPGPPVTVMLPLPGDR